MEELKYQQWSLSRQLASLYASLGMTDETLPKRRAIESWAERENAEEEAERLRSQVRGLLNRLPIKLPTPQEDLTERPQKATEALLNYLAAHGGERGGWNDKDHSMFLHWRSRFRRDTDAFLAAVVDTLPGKTMEQVESHERWYKQLQRLRNDQRKELDEWKQKKRERQEEDKKKAEKELELEGHETWVAEWRKQRETIQEQLQHWKEEKAKQAALTEPSEPPEAARKLAEKEQKRRTEAQYQKLLAYLWRTEQEAAKEAAESADKFVARLSLEETQSQKRRSASAHAEQRERINQQWIQTRKPKQKSNPKVSLAIRPASSSIRVSRDPKRLLRPTSAFIARHLPNSDDSAEERPSERRHYILDVSSRAVPSWRII